MAFKLNWTNAGGRTEEVLENKIKALESKTNLMKLAKAAINPRDIAYTIESLGLARPTLAGDIIYDHVTLAANFERVMNKDFSNDATGFKGAMQDTGNAITGTIQYLMNSGFTREDALMTASLFKKDKPSPDQRPISITLDYVYINVAFNNNLIRQPIKGYKKGTFKTFSDRDDYTITFTGKMIGSNRLSYDVGSIQRLQAIANLGVVLDVDSIYLNRIFKIYQLVISDIQISQSQETGLGNAVDFTITAYSDEDVNVVESIELKL